MAGRRERRERALRLAAEVGVGEAAARTGVSVEMIERWLAAARPVRAKRASVATRRRAVARAAQVGDARAAEEFKVAQATIRSWRRRVAGEPEGASVPVVVPGAAVEASGGGEVVAEGVVGVSGLEGMRRAYAAARRVEAEAVAQASSLLASGQAKDAQAASVAGGVWSDKALALGKAIAAAEADEEGRAARLSEEQLALQRDVLLAMFEALGVVPPVELLGELAARAGAGEPLQVPEDVALRAREVVQGPIRARLAAEVEARVQEAARAREGEPEDKRDGDAVGEREGGEVGGGAGYAGNAGSWREHREGQVRDEPARELSEAELDAVDHPYKPGGRRRYIADGNAVAAQASSPQKTGRGAPRPAPWHDMFRIGQAG
jgi:hypothetical protein